ncbi:MAG: chorismate mutase [Elusimicrobiales bacterium]|jgi:chorismate mutase
MANPLEKKRGRIDAIDARLTGLLAGRLSLAASMTELKKKVRDPGREAAVLRRAARRVKDRTVRPAVVAIYREIIKQSRRLQYGPAGSRRARRGKRMKKHDPKA